MRTLVQFMVVMALLGATPVEAGQAMGNATATLTGDAEVPGPGDPQGSGPIQVPLDPATEAHERSTHVPSEYIGLGR